MAPWWHQCADPRDVAMGNAGDGQPAWVQLVWYVVSPRELIDEGPLARATHAAVADAGRVETLWAAWLAHAPRATPTRGVEGWDAIRADLDALLVAWGILPPRGAA